MEKEGQETDEKKYTPFKAGSFQVSTLEMIIQIIMHFDRNNVLQNIIATPMMLLRVLGTAILDIKKNIPHSLIQQQKTMVIEITSWHPPSWSHSASASGSLLLATPSLRKGILACK